MSDQPVWHRKEVEIDTAKENLFRDYGVEYKYVFPDFILFPEISKHLALSLI